MSGALVRAAMVAVVASVVAGCAGAEPNLLGGREKCWSHSDVRLASLMKGWLDLDADPPAMHTPEDEDLSLTFPFMTLKKTANGPVLMDGATAVAQNGELVTVFGGLGSDASMTVCAIEEHHDG